MILKDGDGDLGIVLANWAGLKIKKPFEMGNLL
jgi:hypothetical protein